MNSEAPGQSEDAIRAKAYSGLQEYGNKMADKAYRVASEGIGVTPTPQSLIDFVGTIEQAMDNQVFRFAGKLEILHQQGVSPEIACRKGCSYCCGTQIMATIPEILRMAKWINENFSAEQIAALRARLAEFNPKVLAIKASGEPRPPMDCPILVEGSCSAHPGRPIACRAANSVNVDACIAAREHWDDDSYDIPLVGQPFYAGKAMTKGLRVAMEDRGLNSPIVDMPVALEIALDNPSAGDQFLAGEPVFDIAVLHATVDSDPSE